jgi:hypothetical protein
MRFSVCSRPYAPGPAPTDYVFCPPPLTVPLEFDAGH